MSSSRKRRSHRSSRATSRPLVLSKQAALTAREALADMGEPEDSVGPHLGAKASPEAPETVATHRFAAQVPGYRGWEWHVVVACAPGSTGVTVNEAALMPAPSGGALQAPDWVPWTRRVLPGDLGPGDLLPPDPDDERLTQDPAEAADPDSCVPQRNALSKVGLREALNRWRSGNYGPNGIFARQSRLHCRTCAFFLPAANPIGENFGVCANELAADGRLVHARYGCGAHSETPDHPVAPQDPRRAFDDERPMY